MLRVYKLASFLWGKFVLRVYKLYGPRSLQIRDRRWVGPVTKTMACIFVLGSVSVCVGRCAYEHGGKV